MLFNIIITAALAEPIAVDNLADVTMPVLIADELVTVDIEPALRAWYLDCAQESESIQDPDALTTEDLADLCGADAPLSEVVALADDVSLGGNVFQLGRFTTTCTCPEKCGGEECDYYAGSGGGLFGGLTITCRGECEQLEQTSTPASEDQAPDPEPEDEGEGASTPAAPQQDECAMETCKNNSYTDTDPERHDAVMFALCQKRGSFTGICADYQ